MAFDRQHFDAMSCPTSVTWTNDIEGMFTQTDVDHMKQVTNGALDLSNYNSVKIYASKIYNEVASGAMPPPGSGEPTWGQDKVNTFGCWIQQGTPQ
ncbi:hypothetical protein LQ948_00490 [Jiella sp. MQZ9-1]|uniref:Uncharacterized protein n=1 Tax=Jiella flava TaxID=2816857 RepID=A0A939FUI2_9HYPH|nr:hypothetical protein [Jiella flava]MBO0661036.1 hypothetical protein [Jiella flava]MCD2469684.1 hypothetical protein [Jiella flava]